MMRKVRLDAAIATSASIKSCGNIVEYYNVALGFQPVGDTRRMRVLPGRRPILIATKYMLFRGQNIRVSNDGGQLIKSTEGCRVFLGFKAKLDLVESYPRER
jgi:hypothetical protein